MKLFEKKSLKNICIFLLILASLLLLVQIPFFQAHKYGYQYKTVYQKVERFKRYEDEPLDVLYLGDSVGWASLSPMMAWQRRGFTSYNLCTSGQWLEDTDAIIANIQGKMPKVLVIEGSMLFAHPNKAKYLMYKYFPLFQYHDYFRYISEIQLNQNYTKGFNSSSNVQPMLDYQGYMSQTSKSDFIQDDTKAYLDGIIEKCHESNTKVMIVAVPNAKGWNQYRHDYLEDYCKEKRLPFIDYNTQLEEIGFDWQTDTRDGGEHVNNNGSLKVMNNLSDFIANTYELEDKRNDSKYYSWNELFGQGE